MYVCVTYNFWEVKKMYIYVNNKLTNWRITNNIKLNIQKLQQNV